MSAIFISHSSKDKDLAIEVCACLKAKGYKSVFLDLDRDDGIIPGDEWEQVLYRELRTCQVLIALMSKNWLSSRWCFAEATHAREKGKRIIGLKLSPDLDVSVLNDTQHFDFTWAQREQGYDRLWSDLEKALDLRGFIRWDTTRSPYPGLEVFEEKDAPIYFGRDNEVQTLQQTLESLRREGHGKHLVLVLGASGSGKSSLVRAGVVPLLKRDQDKWLVIDPFRPTEKPLDALAQAIAQAFACYGETRDWKSIRKIFDCTIGASEERNKGSRLVDLAGDLRMRAQKPGATVLFVIDQVEELLGQADLQIAKSFFSLLQLFLNSPGSLSMALGTLRSDSLGEFQSHLIAGHIPYEPSPLESMKVENFRAVIEGPAKVAGIELETGLAEVMSKDTKTSDALPLLAFTLEQLWSKPGRNGALTITEYQGLGGLQGSLDRMAEKVLPSNPLTKEHEKILRGGFLSLVRISEDGLFLRKPVRWEELPSATQNLLQRYINARLLVSRSEGEGGKGRVIEVAHEALFRVWKRLNKWLEENRDFLQWREQLRFQITQWQEKKKDKGTLLRGAPLADARGWLKERGEELNEQEKKFIRDSELAERRPRLWAAAAEVVGLIVIVVGVSWVFWTRSDIYQIRIALSDAPRLMNLSGQDIREGWMRTLVFIGKPEDALTVARAIEDPYRRSEALAAVVPALSQAGKPEEARKALEKAEDTAKLISDDNFRSESHTEVAKAWAKLHFYYYAMEAAALGTSSDDKLAAYTVIVREYIKEQNPNLAKIMEEEQDNR